MRYEFNFYTDDKTSIFELKTVKKTFLKNLLLSFEKKRQNRGRNIENHLHWIIQFTSFLDQKLKTNKS